MAQDKENPVNPGGGEGADAGDGFVPAGGTLVLDTVEGEQYEEFEEESEDEQVDETAELASGLDELQNQALNSVEVAKQLEQLTDVVLSSAEVSTRSASVAADVSHDMRLVMDSVAEDHKSNIRNSRLMVIAMLAFLVVGLGTFFGISTKMQLNIGQLDAMSLAVGKRIVDLDATVSAFTQASRSMTELTEKLEEMNHNQEKLDTKFEEINKQMSSLPSQVADQSSKNLESKLQALEKEIQTLDAKVQALSNRPAPAQASGDAQKLRKDLDAANAKSKEKAEVKASTPPPSAPRQEPKPGAKLESANKDKEAATKPLAPLKEEVALNDSKPEAKKLSKKEVLKEAKQESKQPKPEVITAEKNEPAKVVVSKTLKGGGEVGEGKAGKEINAAKVDKAQGVEKLAKAEKADKEDMADKADKVTRDSKPSKASKETVASSAAKPAEKLIETKELPQPRKEAMVVYPRVANSVLEN
jgi:prefoldin subunit 5